MMKSNNNKNYSYLENNNNNDTFAKCRFTSYFSNN